ncbi:MAG: hypothetical protein ABI780_01760 [Ardenticatenales bacterium]
MSIAFMDLTRIGPKGELRTSTGLRYGGGVSLLLPDPRVALTTTGVPNLGDHNARYAARISDCLGILPSGLKVDLIWPGPMGHCSCGASLLTCGESPCGIDVTIDGELGELDAPR